MKKSGLGILIFLIVALLIAFFAMKLMQNSASLSDKLEETAGQAVQQAADKVNEALQDIDLEATIQNSGLLDTLQNAFSQIGGAG